MMCRAQEEIESGWLGRWRQSVGGAAAPRQDGPDTLRAISATWSAAFGGGNAALRRWGSVVERGFEPIFRADLLVDEC